MHRTKIISLFVFFFLLTSLAIPAGVVHAESSVTGAEMISLVNSWRTGTYGYSALVESASLDSCAQWTAETMASINATNHLKYLGYSDASERCAGFGFPSGSRVTENYAMGAYMTIDALAGYWSDYAHQMPASMSQYTYVGVGIASASNGMIYYVLEAGSGSGGGSSSSSASVSSSAASTGSTATAVDYSQYITPVVTSTPNYDGYIYHTVQQGQTLFDIALAYGVTVSYIQEQNGLSDTNIYVGNTYKIKQVPTPTITATFTATPVYPTRTPTLKAPTKTPGPVLTPTATPKPSVLDTLQNVDRPSMGLVLMVLSGLGLLTVVFFSFFKPAKEPAPAPAPVVEEVKPKRKKKAVAEEPAAPVKESAPAAKKTKPAPKTAADAVAPAAPVKKAKSETAAETAQTKTETAPRKKTAAKPKVESAPTAAEKSGEPAAPKKRSSKPKNE